LSVSVADALRASPSASYRGLCVTITSRWTEIGRFTNNAGLGVRSRC